MEGAKWLSVIDIFYFVCAAVAAIFTVLTVFMSFVQYRINANISADKDRSFEISRQSFELRIQEAVTEAALANARAAEANEKTEQERLARIKIEQSLLPRLITDAIRQNISEKLTQLSSRRLDIIIFSDESEAIRFAEDIYGAFTNAGWRANI